MESGVGSSEKEEWVAARSVVDFHSCLCPLLEWALTHVTHEANVSNSGAATGSGRAEQRPPLVDFPPRTASPPVVAAAGDGNLGGRR